MFLRPPDTGTGETTIPISRLSIYAGQHEAVQEYAKAAPIVLSSAWQSADGSVAVALANLSDKPVPMHVTLQTPEYPLAPQGFIRRILERESVEVERYRDGRAALETTLDPADVRIYEFVAE